MKTRNTFYNDPNNPTQDELYAVILQYPHYVNFHHYQDEVLSICNYGDCNTCPFTTDRATHCFLNLIEPTTFARIQETHPEYFL